MLAARQRAWHTTDMTTRENRVIPFGMPEQVFDDYKEGAELRRAQWVADNRPDVTFQQLHHTLPLRWETISQLQFEPFGTPFDMPTELFWDTTAGNFKYTDPEKLTGRVDYPGGNDLRRQWVTEAYPNVSNEELEQIESMRTQTLSRLVLSRTIIKGIDVGI